MGISELQMGLVGAGGVVVVGIFAFNKWQERKHRKQSELPVVAVDAAVPGVGPEERIEPVVGGSAASRPAPRASADSGPRRVPPVLPPEVDERADCVVRVESIEPVVGGRLLEAAAQHLQGIGKPVRWFGFSDSDNRWELLDAGSSRSYHLICAALQLVNRRGPASDGDLAGFCGGLQRMCDTVGESLRTRRVEGSMPHTEATEQRPRCRWHR